MQCLDGLFASAEFLGKFNISELDVRIWSDTASHYRNRFIIGELLSSTDMFREIRICFHAEGHGKTKLDSIFKPSKSIVRDIDMSKVKNVSALRKVLVKGFSDMGLGRHVVGFIDGGNNRAGLHPIILPRGTLISVPNFWERSQVGDVVQVLIDKEDLVPLRTGSASFEVKDTIDVVEKYHSISQDSSKILARVRRKAAQSKLIQRISGSSS